MQLPSVEDVNVTRLSRFDDAITAALDQSSRIDAFRDIIAHYVQHHDVPEADVAAALAVVAQGDTPLLLSEQDARNQQRQDREDRERERDARPARDGRDSRDSRPSRDDRGSRDGGWERNERPARAERPERRPRDHTRAMSSYRIEVGKRHKVEPRQIVGALANEGGLSREDFGAIKILPDFSIVDLPADLSGDVLGKLKDTRISGKLIEIQLDTSTPAQREARNAERPPRKSFRD